MADNKDELQLKITLDDGSVVQGFLNINKKAKESGEKIESGFNKGIDAVKDGLNEVAPTAVGVGNRIATALSSPLGLVSASVVALGASLKGAFELTLEGEKLNKIDKQFESLAESFGVAGDALKTKFIDSLGGLVDDSDAVQSLNKAFVTLGDKVTQLPQVMELARKATNLFGGDVTSNFEAINQAVATGATRQLRGLGIVIDSDKAYEKYAKSIGVTKDVLSESGKQQAILNEVLAKGEDRFKNVSSETGGLTSAYTRFTVSLNNANEEIAKSFTTSGGYLERFFTSLDLIVKKISGEPQQKLEDLQNKISETKLRIFELQDALEKRQGSSGFDSFLQPFKDGEGVLATVTTNLANTKKQLEQLNKQYSEIAKTSSDVKNEAQNTSASSYNKDANSVDQELAFKLQQKREKELTDFLLSEDQKRLQSKIQQNALLLNENIAAGTKLSLLEENFSIQDTLREEQKNQQIVAIKQKYALEKLTGSEFEQQSLAAIEESYFQQKLLAEQQRAAQLKAIEQQANFDTLSGFEAVGAGFTAIAQGASDAAAGFANNAVANFKQVGAQATATFSKGVGSAFNNFGAALKNGANASDAFAQAVGDSILQVASQFGDLFIQTGIGKLALSYGADATGYALIAAGAALKILAGFAGAKGGSSPTTDSGGGVSSSPSQTTDLTPSSQLERQQPGTSVQVVIQGDVLDSDESGSRIVDLINNAFDKKGVTVQQGAFA